MAENESNDLNLAEFAVKALVAKGMSEDDARAAVLDEAAGHKTNDKQVKRDLQEPDEEVK